MPRKLICSAPRPRMAGIHRRPRPARPRPHPERAFRREARHGDGRFKGYANPRGLIDPTSNVYLPATGRRIPGHGRQHGRRRGHEVGKASSSQPRRPRAHLRLLQRDPHRRRLRVLLERARHTGLAGRRLPRPGLLRLAAVRDGGVESATSSSSSDSAPSASTAIQVAAIAGAGRIYAADPLRSGAPPPRSSARTPSSTPPPATSACWSRRKRAARRQRRHRIQRQPPRHAGRAPRHRARRQRRRRRLSAAL